MTAQGKDEKRDSVDAALRCWRQGDCVVGEQWFVHRLALDIPLTKEATDAARQGVDLAEAEVRGFLVISQTCDIMRSCVERPYAEVAPLVEVDTGELRTIERGRRPRYAFVPGLKDRNLVGDLDRVMTVEKAVVASWERSAGCATDQETRILAQALARKRTRKLHNIVDSVVVLDEAQLLPPDFLNPILHIIEQLNKHYGVSFVLCTATQPALQPHRSFDVNLDCCRHRYFRIARPSGRAWIETHRRRLSLRSTEDAGDCI